MKQPYIPLIAFAALLLLTTRISFDFATSVVPGWHTTIYPPYFLASAIIFISILFSVIAYWLLLKKNAKISWAIFFIHLVLTIQVVIINRFPNLFLDIQNIEKKKIIGQLSLLSDLIMLSYFLFIAGQFLFVVYFVKAMRKKRT